MLQRFDVTAVHQILEEKTRAYAVAKLAVLDQYIPRHARPSVRLELRLQANKRAGKVQPSCEATLHLPRRVLTVTEAAPTFEAAIDLMKVTLKQQIQRYKRELTSGKHRRHLSARLQRRMPDIAFGAGSI